MERKRGRESSEEERKKGRNRGEQEEHYDLKPEENEVKKIKK